MLRFSLIVVALLPILGELSSGVAAASTANLTRAEIRTMPIEVRPSRPGHFYGNTVRRRASRW